MAGSINPAPDVLNVRDSTERLEAAFFQFRGVPISPCGQEEAVAPGYSKTPRIFRYGLLRLNQDWLFAIKFK